MICKHLELSIRTLVKEFYVNLGERKNLTCYFKGRWVPFGERALSQLFKLKEGVDYSEFEKLRKNPHFKEITKELTSGHGEWQRIRTISNTFINRGDLTKVGKVWFYFLNSMFKPLKHFSTVRQDRAILLYALVKSYGVNVGRIIEESILDYARGNITRNIPDEF